MTNETQFKDYWPLIALVLVGLLAGTAVYASAGGSMISWMHYIMGMIFCEFSLLKIFDVSGFADGFTMYDIIAKRLRSYAVIYPFIELALGLAYLSMVIPIVIYAITMALMAIGSIGVLLALKRGLDLYCPCMGTVLKVPLSTVTLTEDLGMGAMALIMLLFRVL